MDFTSTALITGVAIYIINAFKGFFHDIWSFIKAIVISKISVNSSQMEFSLISSYIFHLYKTAALMKTDNFRVALRSIDIKADETIDNANKFQLNAGDFIIKDPVLGLMWVNIFISENQTGENWRTAQSFGQNCTITVSFLKKGMLDTFIENAIAYNDSQKERHYVYTWSKNDGTWSDNSSNLGREWDTVFIESNMKNKILKDLETFFNSKALYNRIGVPYRRGMMLSGPPGTGKTTLVRGLQNKLKIPLYVVNLNEHNDNTFTMGLSFINAKEAIVLFEDIDVSTDTLTNREKTKSDSRDKVSLSGFLNAIDGVNTPEGLYFIFTSNDPDSLDPAVTRAGRIDCKHELHYMDIKLQHDMIESIIGYYPDDLKGITDDTKACDVQAICLEYLFNQKLK